MIVTYHEVTPDPSRYIYSVSEKLLEEHLSAAAELVRGKPEVSLTFDDGHASHYKFAAPALARFGLQGTFFVTAGWTGTRSDCMTGSQLRDLVSAGHEVQSHGWSHALLTQCSRKELAAELTKSRQMLQEVLGRPVDAISLPGGRCSRRVLRQCAQEGYHRVFTSNPHPGVRRRFGLEIRGRAMVRNGLTADGLLALLRAHPSALSAARLLFASKFAARILAGDAIYQKLWAFVGRSREKATINTLYQEPRP